MMIIVTMHAVDDNSDDFHDDDLEDEDDFYDNSDDLEVDAPGFQLLLLLLPPQLQQLLPRKHLNVGH